MIKIKRSELFQEIAYRTGLTQKVIKQVVQCEEEIVYETIALNSKIHFLWGTLEGISVPPQRIAGCYTQYRKVRNNHGWSVFKKGMPKCTFSRIAKSYEACPPSEYFEDPDHRYTSLARQWRKDSGVPEIPEYAGLSEKQIKKYCQKADEKELMKLGKHKRRQVLYNKKEALKNKIAQREYWEKTGYVPMGALWDEELGDKNWTGPQRTAVDAILARAEREEDPEKKEILYKKAEMVKLELEEEQKEFKESVELAKEIEDRIKQERVRLHNIEVKEDRDYFTYGYSDESYNKLKEIREARIKKLWLNKEEYEEFKKKGNFEEYLKKCEEEKNKENKEDNDSTSTE